MRSKILLPSILSVLCLVMVSSCTKDNDGATGKIHVTNTLWVNYRIFANGTELGIVPRESETTWDIDPGFYSFKAETENLNFLLDDASTTENIDPGQTFHWTLQK